MLATYILFLREGLEASLVVSILFAALRQLNQIKQARAVWIGVGLAILGSILSGALIFTLVHEYADTTGQTIFETCTYLVAVVLLTAMTFWVQKHSRTLKQEITLKAEAAGSGFALGLLAFTSVGREGVESAFFTLAFAFQTNGWLLVSGGVLGILSAVALCFGIYRLGYRLNYRLFFRVMGILLLFFAAGLLANAVQNAQALGWITFGMSPVWNTAHLLSEESALGDLLHGLIGYAQEPTMLQASVYILFLTISCGIFTWMTRKPSSGKPTKASLSTSSQTLTSNG
ncbi:MAG TPA: FTR1 family protein [Ktedonobacteraceae bacterium]|nr:FTR1 family protein [Ktedonobacteraceae bacterium]